LESDYEEQRIQERKEMSLERERLATVRERLMVEKKENE
jgi:hypothetical protein